MKTIVHLNKWANAHTYVYIDIVCIATGLFLLLKGIQFTNQADYLLDILRPIHPEPLSLFLVHYVAMAHMAGGVLILFGLLTRLSMLVQLPILLGAFVVNFIGYFSWSNLAQSSILLLAAVFFLFYGSGKHSADYSLKMNM